MDPDPIKRPVVHNTPMSFIRYDEKIGKRKKKIIQILAIWRERRRTCRFETFLCYLYLYASYSNREKIIRATRNDGAFRSSEGKKGASEDNRNWKDGFGRNAREQIF